MNLRQHALHFEAFGFSVLQRYADAAELSAEFDACMREAFADPTPMNAGTAGNQFRYVPTMCERPPQKPGFGATAGARDVCDSKCSRASQPRKGHDVPRLDEVASRFGLVREERGFHVLLGTR